MRRKIIISIALLFLLLFGIYQVKAANLNEVEQAKEGQAENNQEIQVLDEVNQKANNEAKELETTEYIINNGIIYRVLPETSVEEFKKGFTIPEEIKIYSDSTCKNEVTSGIIGTGMVVKNLTDNTVYTISVIGDFNNDGKISQVELTQLIRHVVGLKDYQLSGAIWRLLI